MIKIINNPNPVGVPTWKVTCDRCQCEFSYQGEDVSDDWNHVCGPGSCGGRHVFCPNCGERVWPSMRDEDLINTPTSN